jgi:hypothetical protein
MKRKSNAKEKTDMQQSVKGYHEMQEMFQFRIMIGERR